MEWITFSTEHAEVADDVDVQPVGELILKGFSRPVAAFDVVAVRDREERDDADVAVSRADASAARPARP